ncbi:MAG: hypothetical protein FD143_905 [Ignavibacteria bacterium]|nr:MAG: hypothetical protein FD143_905 [Ignavibacteria bacterium]KAF0161149.1 MAG: hypothetical protein FD188_1060 [Ignavibacteria bacterium]
MIETLGGALLIAIMRIADVTIGTFRTIMVVQGRKYQAAVAGFFEVLIWIFAMRFIVQHMDNMYNLLGYAIGFALGNVLGISLEQRVALGYVQVNIVSQQKTDSIAATLREKCFGVTILPGEGKSGEISILIAIIKRKFLKDLMITVESIDKRAFITVQTSHPYRGFMHGSRV